MYMSGAYDVLFLPKFLSNRLKNFFRIYSQFPDSLCVDRCRFNDVHIRLSPIHGMIRQTQAEMREMCPGRVALLTLYMLNLIF